LIDGSDGPDELIDPSRLWVAATASRVRLARTDGAWFRANCFGN
jgi:hypothetical protein